jgi:hypothetical protein
MIEGRAAWMWKQHISKLKNNIKNYFRENDIVTDLIKTLPGNRQ